MGNCYRYVIFTVCMLLGGFLLCYPVVSNYVHQEESRIQIQAYEEGISGKDEQEIERILAQALAYNQSLTDAQTVLTDPFLSNGVKGESGIDGTILDLDGSGQIGYLEIPSIDVQLPIYEGTGETALTKGVGHLEGSSLPVGGESTHTVIAGHTGMDFARLFTDLDKMKEGDCFYLYVLNKKLVYQVSKIEVVLPEETDSLAICEGKDLCTLVTCTPYGMNTHRLLVTGERAYEEGEENLTQTEHSAGNGTFWRNKKKVLLWGIVVVAGLLLYMAPWIRTALFQHASEEKISEVERVSKELSDDGTGESEIHQSLSAYNGRLRTGGQEGFYDGTELQELEKLCDSWAENGFGIIEIPRMGVSLPLFLGATDTHLASGVAVMEGTSIPLGTDSEGSNAVIAGHRGYQGIPFFRDIEELKEGDPVYITNPWGTFTYLVESIKIVAPDDLESLKIQNGKDMVTLLTCHPYQSHGKQRYLVYCVRTDTGETVSDKMDTGDITVGENETETANKEETGSISEKIIFGEKLARLTGIGLLAFCVCRCMGKRRRRGKNET